MKKFKFLSVVLVVLLVMSMSLVTYAKSFSDVDNESHEWAIDAIENMAELGIITGYEDGTFKPDKTVTKLEALLLTARILGVNAPENELFLETAINKYGEIVEEFELDFGSNEICYLLSKRILNENELAEYIGKDNASEGMKRYEVAVLMTKALDAEATVSKNLITSLEFDDTQDIPAYAKKYVEFVVKSEIMNGTGNNMFSPNSTVTRAQIAKLMNKLLELSPFTFFNGQVAEIDYASKLIKVKSDSDNLKYTINSGVLIRYEGEEITINEIAAGYTAVLTLKNNSLYAIDLITPIVDKEVSGIVTSKTAGSKPSVSINVLSENDTTINSDIKETYPLSSDIAITYQDEPATMKEVVVGSLVKISVKKGEASVIRAYPKTQNISGRISSVEITPVCRVIVELTDGTENAYTLANEVEVTKNGAKASAADILSGDTVTLTLTYEKVSKIIASSKKQDKTGVIQEVIISASPKITVKTDDGVVTYSISNSCEIEMPGKADATFYDLRVGVAVTLSMEGSTVTKLKTTVSEGVTQINGTVSSVNSSYSVIQVTYTDVNSGITVTEPVFVKAKATIVDILTGNTIKLANIEPGSIITAFGMRNSGVFEATTINVTGK